jgi:hypothetical protein
MKKIFLAAALILIMCSGCGTILGGKITACQKTKPAPGQPKRQIRPAALIGDIAAGGWCTVIDFIDGGIYKPCQTTNK